MVALYTPSRAGHLLEEYAPFMYQQQQQEQEPKNYAAGTLLLIGETILLLQRSSKVPQAFTWSGAGGHAEGNETPYQAALRETQEELQLDLRLERPSSSFAQTVPPQGLQRVFTTFVYRFPRFPVTWSPQIDEESLAWGLFTREALTTLKLHPGLMDALKHIEWNH